MSKEIDISALQLEWETFDWPVQFSKINCENGIYNLPRTAEVSINRTSEYKLTGTISGSIKDIEDLKYKRYEAQLQAGEHLEIEKIAGTKTGYETFSLKMLLNGHILTPMGSPANPYTNFKADILLWELEQQDNAYTPSETETLIEFYICGKTEFFWPRVTSRKKTTKIAKIRNGIDEDIEVPVKVTQKGEGTARDSMLIETTENFIFIQKVNASYLPDWANGIQFEYRNKVKQIPNNEERIAISEIVSFVLGTHLLKVGDTHFDEAHNVVKKTAYSPWGDNVISKCKSVAQPPISYQNHDDWGNIEGILSNLVPVYLEKRAEYNLRDVLWKYWIAEELPIGTNLPIMSSGLETLAEAYISANNLIKNYAKAERKVYKELVSDELKSLKSKLKDYDFNKRVVDKLENPFNVGVGEKIKLFFSFLKFDFDSNSIENQAIRARNAMTHGPFENNETEIRKYIKLSHAYKSLFNRSLLRVLGYDGTYKDYSSLGHPDLDIQQNLNGKI